MWRLPQLDTHADDVVAPSCFLVHSCRRAAQERQDTTLHPHRTTRWGQQSRHDGEQGRLAGPVRSHEAESRPLRDVEVDRLQSVDHHRVVKLPSSCLHDTVLEVVVPDGKQLVLGVDTSQGDRRHQDTQYGKRDRERAKTQNASTTLAAVTVATPVQVNADGISPSRGSRKIPSR